MSSSLLSKKQYLIQSFPQDLPQTCATYIRWFTMNFPPSYILKTILDKLHNHHETVIIKASIKEENNGGLLFEFTFGGDDPSSVSFVIFYEE